MSVAPKKREAEVIDLMVGRGRFGLIRQFWCE
jgi:hypothetical protein